jgi:hypothetical protein
LHLTASFLIVSEKNALTGYIPSELYLLTNAGMHFGMFLRRLINYTNSFES